MKAWKLESMDSALGDGIWEEEMNDEIGLSIWSWSV